MTQAALDLVITALETIRKENERGPRASRAVLARLQSSDPVALSLETLASLPERPLQVSQNKEELLTAIRDRVRAHGHWIMGPLDHGFCKSIYLAAPEGIMLEFSTSEGNAIDAESWIDPEVMALAGISLDEVEKYKHPAQFESKGGKVAQPKPDPSKPLMDYPADDRIWTMSDEEVTRRMSNTTPPVQKKDKAA